MRRPAFCAAILAYVVMGHPSPAVAQVDRQRAQERLQGSPALCERDGGRLWRASICAPMVIGDARTQTFATSQPRPDAPRPKLIGILNGPIEWGDTMWAALTWDTIANWPARTRGEAFVHESFHIVEPRLGLTLPSISAGAVSQYDASDFVEGRGIRCASNWRSLAGALSGITERAMRAQDRSRRRAAARSRMTRAAAPIGRAVALRASGLRLRHR